MDPEKCLPTPRHAPDPSFFSLISRHVVARIPLHLLYCLNNKPTIARGFRPSCLPSLAQEGPRRQALLLNLRTVREKLGLGLAGIFLEPGWDPFLLQGPCRVAVRHRARLGGCLTNKPTQETSPSRLRSLTQQGADHAYAPTGIRTHGQAQRLCSNSPKG